MLPRAFRKALNGKEQRLKLNIEKVQNLNFRSQNAEEVKLCKGIEDKSPPGMYELFSKV